MTLLSRLAWRNLWRQRRRTLITAGAMAIGLAFCMSMVALVDGIYTDLFALVVSEKIGHAQIHHPEYPKKRAMWETVDDADALLAELDALPEVAATSPRVYGYGLLAHTDEAVGAQLVGIRPDREAALTSVADKVTAGRFLGDAAAGEVVLGAGLAERLEVAVGGELVAVTQAADGSTGNDLYRVVGIAETGSVVQDRGAAWLHAADLQSLLVLDGQVHEIAVLATGFDQVDGLVAAVEPRAAARGLLARSWRDINPQMAQMMEMADASSMIMLLFIFGVAALGILNTMLMSVFERTKELGVIRALGLRPLQLVRLVMWETVWLGVVACLIGLPVGFALDAYLVLHGLDLSGVMEGYSIMGVEYQPVYVGEFHAAKVLQVVVGMFAISLLAAVWPAVRVARLQPVVAMRQE